METNGQKNRIIFFGTPEIAADALRALHKAGYNLAAAVTQPDKPTGRAGKSTPPSVKIAAQKFGIPVFQPATLKDGDFLQKFRELKPDLGVVFSYGKIFPASFFEIPPLGFINIHFSLLPAYRGASPLPTAIMNGDQESGVTIALLAPEVDSGPILAQKRLPIPSDVYYLELLQIYTREGILLLLENLPRYLAGELKPRAQDHTKATFTKLFTRIDGRIDWSRSAEQIYNQIRALSFEPGTWTTWENTEIKIIKAHPAANQLFEAVPPGTIIKTENKIAVATGAGLLVLETIQAAGAKPMPVTDFVRGWPGFIGAPLK